MLGWTILFLYFAAVLLVGFGILQFIMRRAEPMRAELWLPISFGLGLGAQCLVYLLFLFIFGRIYLLPAALFLLFIAAAGLWYGGKGIPEEFPGFEFIQTPGLKKFRGVYWIIICLGIFFLALLYTNAASYPFTSYDGRAIWSYKATILLHEHTIFNDAFLDPYRIHYHRNYPLLVPFAEYSIYSLFGEVAERKVRFLFSTFFLFQVLFFYGILRRFGGGKFLSVLIPLLYCATPFRDDWYEVDGGALNSGAVDIPLSFLAMVAATMNLLWWRERRRWQWIIAVVFSGLCLMTKQEGIVIVAALFGANVLYALFGHVKNHLRSLAVPALILAASILLALPWFLIQRQLPNFYDEDYASQFNIAFMSQIHQRIPMITDKAVTEIFFIRKWNAYWIAYAVMLFLAIPGWFKRRDFWLDSVIILWAGAYFFTYMMSPLNLVFHLNTSTSRLMSHFLPLVLVRLALFFHEHNQLVLDEEADSLEKSGKVEG